MNDHAMRKTVEEKVRERAQRDPAFRQLLTTDPRSALRDEVGIEIPEDVKITVVEESPSTVYLVLPQESAAAGQELSDDELDEVAGGCSVIAAYGPTNSQNCAYM